MLIDYEVNDIELLVNSMFQADICAGTEIQDAIGLLVQRSVNHSDDIESFFNSLSEQLELFQSYYDEMNKAKVIEKSQVSYFFCVIATKQLTEIQKKWSFFTFRLILELARFKATQTAVSLCKRMRLFLTEDSFVYRWFWQEEKVISLSNDLFDIDKLSNELEALKQHIKYALYKLNKHEIEQSEETHYTEQHYNQIDELCTLINVIQNQGKHRQRTNSDVDAFAIQLTLFDENIDVVIKEQTHHKEQNLLIDELFDVDVHVAFNNSKINFDEDNAAVVSDVVYVDVKKQQRYDTRILSTVAIQHRSKRNMQLLSDVNVLTLSNYRAVYTHIQQQFAQTNDAMLRSAYASLLLSMSTGISVKQLIELGKDVAHLFHQIAGKLYYSISLDITTLSTARKAELRGLRLNASLSCEIEVKQTLVKSIAQYDLSHEYVMHVILNIKHALGLTYLSISRIETTASILLSRFIANQLIADVLTNSSAQNSTPLFYASLDINALYLDIKQIEALLTEKHNDDVVAVSNNVKKQLKVKKTFGSQIAPSFEAASELMQLLKENVVKFDVSIENFNHYALYMWHLIQLLTGMRPITGLGFLQDIDIANGLMSVKDKDNRAVPNSRLVPLCDLLCDELQKYLSFQQTFLLRHQLTEIGNLEQLSLHADNRYVVYVVENKRLKPVSVGFVKQHIDFLQENWPRHLVRSYLSLIHPNAPEALVNGLFGHEQPMFEVLGQFSCVSVAQIKSMAYYVDELAANLNLTPLFADAEGGLT